jgi:hypothetical protein
MARGEFMLYIKWHFIFRFFLIGATIFFLTACEPSKSSGSSNNVIQTSINLKGNFLTSGTLTQTEQDAINLCKQAGNNSQKLDSTSGTSLLNTVNINSLSVKSKFTEEIAGLSDGYQVQYSITEVTSATQVKYSGTYIYAPSLIASIIGKTINFDMLVTVATNAYGYSVSRTVSSDMEKVLTANEISNSLQLSLYSKNCDDYNFNYTSPTTSTVEGGTFIMASGTQLPAIKLTYAYPGQITCGTSTSSPEAAIKEQTLILSKNYFNPVDSPYCVGGSILYDFSDIKATGSDKMRQEKNEILSYSAGE